MAKIVDVSVYNGVIDWTKAKANGVSGAILKIIGKGCLQDKQFDNNHKGCNNAKVPWGVYCYSYATTVAKAKSDMTVLCDILDKVDKTCFDLGVWFDIEDKCQQNLPISVLADILNTAQKTVEARGYNFGIYTGQSFYQEHKFGSIGITCKNWWIARYYNGSTTMPIETSPNPEKKPNIGVDMMAWQYTANGKIDGISGFFDISELYKEFPKKEEKPEGPPYTKVTKTSSKVKIKWMQKRLNVCYTGKLAKLEVDGIWGPKTQKTFEEYRVQIGLMPNTYCGKTMCTALWKGKKKK